MRRDNVASPPDCTDHAPRGKVTDACRRALHKRYRDISISSWWHRCFSLALRRTPASRTPISPGSPRRMWPCSRHCNPSMSPSDQRGRKSLPPIRWTCRLWSKLRPLRIPPRGPPGFALPMHLLRTRPGPHGRPAHHPCQPSPSRHRAPHAAIGMRPRMLCRGLT